MLESFTYLRITYLPSPIFAPFGKYTSYEESSSRIISRRETKVIVSKAKKIEEVKEDQKLYEQKCKNLGKYIFKVFKGQDNRPAEYVKSPN